MSASESTAPPASNGGDLTVYYDGACPLCAKEIAGYRRLPGADAIDWIDVSRCGSGTLGPDLDPSAALARLHVRCADGTLVDGAAAFATLWLRLPTLARLGRVAKQPVVLAVLEGGYSAFLRVRRLWHAPFDGLPHVIVGDLRTDHAGKTGAVMIYRGILAVTHDDNVRRFAQRHLATELRHLAVTEDMVPASRRTMLLPLWRAAGWLTGALPAVAGPRAVYATIEAVETFVARHYTEQLMRIDMLDPPPHDLPLQAARALLTECRRDEVAHRDEAAASAAPASGIVLRAWRWLIAAASAVAVTVSRRI